MLNITVQAVVVNCMYNVLISPSYKREFIPFLGEGDILVILTMLSKAGQFLDLDPGQDDSLNKSSLGSNVCYLRQGFGCNCKNACVSYALDLRAMSLSFRFWLFHIGILT